MKSGLRLDSVVLLTVLCVNLARGQHYRITDPAPANGFGSLAAAVNNAGEVAGGLTTSGYGDGDAFTWLNGVYTDIGRVAGRQATAYGINSNGMVVGLSTYPG